MASNSEVRSSWRRVENLIETGSAGDRIGLRSSWPYDYTAFARQDSANGGEEFYQEGVSFVRCRFAMRRLVLKNGKGPVVSASDGYDFSRILE